MEMGEIATERGEGGEGEGGGGGGDGDTDREGEGEERHVELYCIIDACVCI